MALSPNLDMARLAGMSPDEALEYLRRLYSGDSVGPLTETVFDGGDNGIARTLNVGGNAASPSDGWRPLQSGVNQKIYERNLTPEFDPSYSGGVYGRYIGEYDPEGNLQGVQFAKGERDDGWMANNIDKIALGIILGGVGGLFGGESLFSAIANAGNSGLIDPGIGGTLGGDAAGSYGSITDFGPYYAQDPLMLGSTGTNIPGTLTGSNTLLDTLIGGTKDALGLGVKAVGSVGGLASGLLNNQLAGRVLGAALGAGASTDKTKESNATREPWGPAQPWLQSLLSQGEALNKKYADAPLSDRQKEQYSNFFGDLNKFRTETAPSLFGISNKIRSNPYVAPTMPNQDLGPTQPWWLQNLLR